MQRIWWWLSLLSVVAVLALSFAYQGAIVIDWGDYQVQMHSFSAILLLIISFYIASRFMKIWWWIRSTPRYFAELRTRQKLEARVALYNQLHLAYARNNQQEVERIADKLSKANLHQVDSALLLKGYNSLENGDCAEAYSIFNQLYSTPAFQEAALRGLILVASKQQDLATLDKYMPIALKLFGTQAWMFTATLDYYKRHGQLKEALAITSRAADKTIIGQEESATLKAKLYLEAATSLLEQGDIAQATRHLAAGLKLNPTYLPSIELYAELLVHGGEDKKAWRMILRAWEVSANQDLVILVGKIFTGNSGNIRARYFAELSAIHPSQPWPHLLLAKEYLSLRQFADARKHALQAQESNPSSATLTLLAEIALADSGNVEEALDWLRKVSLNPAISKHK